MGAYVRTEDLPISLQAEKYPSGTEKIGIPEQTVSSVIKSKWPRTLPFLPFVSGERNLMNV